MATGREKYTNLDAIRGIAALLIVLRHTPAAFLPPHFQQSYLAVDLFFVMSGFVIASAYEDKIASGKLGFRNFMRIRLIRLYPLYLVGALVGLPVYFMQHASPDTSAMSLTIRTALVLAPSLLMLPARSHPLYPLDGPAWSLLFELISNAVYGAIHQHLSNRRLLTTSAIAALIIVAHCLHDGDLDIGFHLSDFIVALARVSFSFSAGVLLYRKRSVFQSFAAKSARLTVLFTAFPLAAVAALLCIDVPAPLSSIVTASTVIVLMPLLVMVAASVTPPAFCRPIFEWMGRVSYGAYIIHVPLLVLVGDATAAMDPGLASRPATLPLLIIAFIVLVHLLDKYMDIPFRKVLTRVWVQPQTKVKDVDLARHS
jgi:peptidoglycan/LPS O-acetylase OafA/YrhL